MPVSPHIANQVLFAYNAGGYRAGLFIEALIDLCGRADPDNRALLARGFPQYAAAVSLAQAPGGIDTLTASAAGQLDELAPALMPASPLRLPTQVIAEVLDEHGLSKNAAAFIALLVAARLNEAWMLILADPT